MVPTPAELLEVAHVVDIPLRVPFRGLTRREALLLHGPHGWAEFAPFVEYPDREAATWLAAAVEAGWEGWPAPARELIAVNATVPAVPAEQVASVLEAFPGSRTAKVKVAGRGDDLSADLARVAAVRDVLGPGGAIRVDANGGWDLGQARDALRALSVYGLEYAEQPVSGVDDLARLRVALARDGVDVPVAADESIRRAEDPLRVARAGAADLVVVGGGVLHTLAHARMEQRETPLALAGQSGTYEVHAPDPHRAQLDQVRTMGFDLALVPSDATLVSMAPEESVSRTRGLPDRPSWRAPPHRPPGRAPPSV